MRVRWICREWLTRGGGAILLACALPTPAATPLVPLNVPVFTLDRASPGLIGQPFSANDLLTLGTGNQLSVLIHGYEIGLGRTGDEVDGLSNPHASLVGSQRFVLLFSVDRTSLSGSTPPDPNLVAAGTPYSATDQAARGQAAGDQFMSTRVFTLAGPEPGLRGTDNNSLCRNNYDEGGTDFSALPASSAEDVVIGEPQDNVECATDISLDKALGVWHLYFTLTGDSPSLSFIAGGQSASGATVYQTRGSGAQYTSIYAPYAQLGLQQNDDIDALFVVDANTNGIFDGDDRVFFSLRPGSPSLQFIPNTTPMAGGADIFVSTPSVPPHVPAVFASAGILGLVGTSSAPANIDSLDILPCTNCDNVIALHCIRAVPGDWDDDGVVAFPDVFGWIDCMHGPGVPFGVNCESLDLEQDHDVDIADMAQFQQLFDGTVFVRNVK